MGGATTSTRRPNSKPTSDEASPVGKTIRQIMERAVKTGASDVHIEPRPGYGLVRQRVDGLLQITTKLPGASFDEIVVHLKKLAGLNTRQRQAPQSGHYSFALGRRSYEIQIATLPIMDGERIALHIADAGLEPISLPELGYWGSGLAAINHALAQPRGLIVVGSTDQTSTLLTLASMLSTLNSPQLSLASVEQYQLYQLPNVDQALVKKEIGMTFARRLKQTLRREPSVLMISDVLDKPTATALTKAAASRQLVLAGVHAADAAGALIGLTQLSAEPALLAAALQIVITGQLVAKLCTECREAYTPSIALVQQLAKIFGTNNAARMAKLHKLETEALAEQLGVGNVQQLSAKPSTSEQHIVRLWQARAGGCKACDLTGYGGRTTIGEVVPSSNSLQISLQTAASTAGLRKAGRASNALPLPLDALIKALRGVLPIETVLAHTPSR